MDLSSIESPYRRWIWFPSAQGGCSSERTELEWLFCAHPRSHLLRNPPWTPTLPKTSPQGSPSLGVLEKQIAAPNRNNNKNEIKIQRSSLWLRAICIIWHNLLGRIGGRRGEQVFCWGEGCTMLNAAIRWLHLSGFFLIRINMSQVKKGFCGLSLFLSPTYFFPLKKAK